MGEASHPGPAGLKAKWRKQSGLAQPITKGEIAKVCHSIFTEFLEQWAAHQPPQRVSRDDWRKWPRDPDQDYADWRASDAEWHGYRGDGSSAASAKDWDGLWNALHGALLGMRLPLELAMALMLGSLGRVVLFLLGTRMLSRGLALAVRCRTTVLLLRRFG